MKKLEQRRAYDQVVCIHLHYSGVYMSLDSPKLYQGKAWKDGKSA